MKAATHLMLLAAGLLALPLRAQTAPDPSALVEPVAQAVEAKNEASSLDAPAAPAAAQPAAPAAEAPATPPADAGNAIEVVEPTGTGAGAAPAPGVAAPPDKPADEGFIIKDASLNDIFQFLAKNAGKQYFHNAQIAGPAYTVTGHLNNGDPLQQMEELAFMYGLSLHVKGNTIYALTQAQLSQLPSSEFHYQLRYLRPSDVESIKDLIRPVLTPGTGIVNFEPKTNTIIIIDSANRIEAAQRLLHGIDKAKGQIIVETKILRVNSSAAERTGIDWSGALGPDGTSMGLARNLNAIFGIATNPTDFAGGIFEEANLVLSPFQVDGLLRALAQGQLASQISNPTLITEDNERSTISIIDRVPIITTQTTAASAGAQPTVTEEVRYKIDQSDKTIDTDPESHREIGISLVVTPTLLPDGTVRMKMRPRSAQITGEVIGATNNRYPEVTESMIETLARVPNGHSLVVGGFYGETNTDGSNKVPLLGDIPILNFFFKSKETIKEKTSLVFIVTPTSYDPTSGAATDRIGNRIRTATSFEKDYNWVEPDNPGPAHEANMKRSIRGLQPDQAPYYPRPEELQPAPSGGKSTPSTQGKPRFSSFR